MAVLEVKNLCKEYPSFRLENISFSVEQGSIMGFIGRNGAGKTTTLKSILNLVHPSAGEISYFGLSLAEHEREIKQRIGYAGGAVDYYKRKRISEIVDVTRMFYENWDEKEYRRYLDAFSLDPAKTPSQLSEGMKVKLNLTLALSHHAELLILDEPTSGLDPVSRDELLDAFTFLRERGVAVLFSTHITSDLEKCADHITYIVKGKLISSAPMDVFFEQNRAEGYGSTLEEIMIRHEKENIREKLVD
ncbi:MAG: ABC transporter ATP-binding protein [Oscillospiraceae bacterium]|nr:ABC transporter ATP-binding protein [Oscillospiraceae bacterium]